MMRRSKVALTGILLTLGMLPVASATGQPVDTICKPKNVVVWNVQPRVHVQCTATVGGGIRYFAYPADDPDAVARVLTILTAARAAGADLVINYDPADTSGAAKGCNPNDCRLIRAVGF